NKGSSSEGSTASIVPATKILVAQPNLKLLRVQQQFTCFKFSGSACTTSTCSFDWTKCKSIGSFPPGPAKHGFECCWCRHAGFSSQQSADMRLCVCRARMHAFVCVCLHQ
ncbi:hypothetical protein LOK49_Contig141G00008, partial [Camellia lanceoleosa]